MAIHYAGLNDLNLRVRYQSSKFPRGPLFARNRDNLGDRVGKSDVGEPLSPGMSEYDHLNPFPP